MKAPSEEVTVQSGVSVSKIGIIKTTGLRKGSRFPVLKKGELVTDEIAIFLKKNDGTITKFLSEPYILSEISSAINKHMSEYNH